MKSWRALTMVGAVVLLWIVFASTTGGTFLTPRNLSLLARQMSVTSILAVGMVLVIVAGQIDLSVGSMSGLLGSVAALLFVDRGWPLPAAFAAAVGLGGVLGLAQGWLVAAFGIPAFIVTLGGMLLFQGVLLGITRGVAIAPTPDFLAVGQAFVPPWAGWTLTAGLAGWFLFRAFRGDPRSRARSIGLAILAIACTGVMSAYQGVPVPVLLMLALASVFAVLARHTPFGRALYAIGGNREAALYSGIDIRSHLLRVFTLMGVMCGVAGVVLTARVGAATSEAGRMMELDAIAAAVIGGTSLMGGRGTVWGALLGALIMASLDNGLSLMNTEAYWQPIIKGAILVLAVGTDVATKKR